MSDPRSVLLRRLQAAFDTVQPGSDPVLRPSERADFQANGALALGKKLGQKPTEVASRIVTVARLDDVCETVEVSGPGFINLTLSDHFVVTVLTEMTADDRLGIPQAATPQTVVVDYSAPNVAKEMHVGHLRSTIIGDALCRMLGFAGHRIVRENHIGDWGTPFGMLIEHLLDVGEEQAIHDVSVGDLDSFYRQSRVSFDADETFRERSRGRVVLLQAGDVETLRLWRILVERSVGYFDEVYSKLGVLLTDEDVVGESYYNDALADVVRDLDAAGLLVESEGAQCVFPPGFTNRNGDPLPLIVQKSDEGFGYAATDLAAIRDRVSRLGAGCLVYVVGAEQAQHLEMCFAVARLAGWLSEGARAVHVSHGLVLGTDHKKLRSRSGAPVKLVELLDEAVDRADAAIAEREPNLPVTERKKLAEAIGIGAVKYADLSTERTRDDVFDWERMLAFEGSTGPYLQYAYARIRSIFRRAQADAGGASDAGAGSRARDLGEPPFELGEPAERSLALALLGFSSSFVDALEQWSPSRLCAYLFDLATEFTTFYETCPVLQAEEHKRRSRLALCDATARVLKQGLELLGISAPEQM